MKGIAFKPNLIKAIRDGIKTQTRRIIKPQPLVLCNLEGALALVWDNGYNVVKCRYQPNETVYIKETCNAVYDDTINWRGEYNDGTNPIVYPPKEWILEHYTDYSVSYTARTMPMWAARYFIEIIKVKAQRLQDITIRDIKAEGTLVYEDSYRGKGNSISQCRLRFARLWNEINKKPYDWESNPFVWVISFRRI